MFREALADGRFPARANLMVEPRAIAIGAGTYWRASVAGATVTTAALTGQTPPFPGGPSTAVQATVTAAGGTYIDIRTGDVNPYRIPVVAGRTYSLGIWAKFSAATAQVSTYVQWTDAGGAIVTTVTTNNDGAAEAGVWRLYKKENLVAPANATHVQFIVRRIATLANGETVTGTAALCEEGPVLRNYFDGTMRNAAWAGAANASRSLSNGWAGLT